MNRKQSLALKTAIMLLLSMTACQKHEVENLSNGNLIPISLSDHSHIQTKVTGTSFDENDEIGLFVMEGSNTLKEKRHIDNMRFLLKESLWKPDADIFYPEGNPNCRFIAYYPYKSQAIKEGESTITCNVCPNQDENNNYSISDFLVAEKSSVTPSIEAVPLVFKHKLAELCIELLPGTAYGTAEELLAEKPVIKIKGVATQVDYDIETEVYTNQAVISDIIPIGTYNVSGGKVVGKHAVVVPQDVAGDHLLVEVTLGSKIYSFTFGTKHSIAPATKETYTLTIHKALTQGSISPSISDWENNSSINGDLNESGQDSGDDNEPTPPVSSEAYKINLPDFNGTSIYQAMNGNTQIAEVCREYLYTTDISNQAIVVYPVHDGNTELSKGYVAKVLDGYNGNPMPGSVHGGTVSWNSSNNTLTYQKGSENTTSTIYIDKEGNISASTLITNPIELSVSPCYLHDSRGDYDYPVTKIATQYWMAENLHATTTTDGVNIKKIEDEKKWQDAYETQQAAFNINNNNTFYNSFASILTNLPVDGWKVPESNDFKKLNTYIGGQVTILKVNSWSGTDLSGFSAIETGYTSSVGTHTAPNAYYWYTGKGGYKLGTEFASTPGCATDGLCIRCIRK